MWWDLAAIPSFTKPFGRHLESRPKLIFQGKAGVFILPWYLLSALLVGRQPSLGKGPKEIGEENFGTEI